MKSVRIILGLCALAIGSLAVASPLMEGNSTVYAVPSQPSSHTCASIHFGMEDSSLQAMTYDCSTNTSNLAGRYVVQGVTVDSISCTNVYHGGNYTADDARFGQYAIRVGKSKGKGEIAITFSESIIGCTVYALQYASDPVEVLVNGQPTSLANSAPSMTKANATALTYDAYQFTFDATKELVIESKQASKTVNGKSVSASRFYLADIALRVSA